MAKFLEKVLDKYGPTVLINIMCLSIAFLAILVLLKQN